MKKNILTIAGLLPLIAFAQNELYVDGATVTVQNGALVHVNGDVTITNGGVVTNEGNIQLTGNWTNNVSGGLTYGAATTNTVHFVGSGTQVIGGAEPTSFNNLTLNGPTSVSLDINASAGGNGSGVLALNDSELDLNSWTMTIVNPVNTAITRNLGYVLSETDPSDGYGFVDWRVGNNTATYTVPFGTSSGTYIPFVFTVTTAGSPSGSAGLQVATYPTDANAFPNNEPWPTGTTYMTDAFYDSLWDKIVDRFWITNVSGYSTNPTMTYTFTYDDPDFGGNNNITESFLQAVYWDSAFWSADPIGSADPTTNQVTGVSGVDFSAPWLLLDPEGLVLPVTLTTFNAEPVDNTYITVYWNTVVEIDNRGFELQRSTDMVNFESIAWVNGQGNALGTTRYVYDDHDAKKNVIYYYRLKQVGMDGNFSHSRIAAASLSATDALTVGEFYPNPTLNLSHIDIYSPTEHVLAVEVFDGLGRSVKSSPAYIAAGQNTMSLNMDQFAHGTYVVKLNLAGETYPKRLIKLQ